MFFGEKWMENSCFMLFSRPEANVSLDKSVLLISCVGWISILF